MHLAELTHPDGHAQAGLKCIYNSSNSLYNVDIVCKACMRTNLHYPTDHRTFSTTRGSLEPTVWPWSATPRSATTQAGFIK